MVLIDAIFNEDYDEVDEVSVPLRGLWFLSISKATARKLFEKGGFRPLAGIMVLIDSQVLTRFPLMTGFRPLAGIMVLIAYELDGDFYCASC